MSGFQQTFTYSHLSKCLLKAVKQSPQSVEEELQGKEDALHNYTDSDKLKTFDAKSFTLFTISSFRSKGPM